MLSGGARNARVLAGRCRLALQSGQMDRARGLSFEQHSTARRNRANASNETKDTNFRVGHLFAEFLQAPETNSRIFSPFTDSRRAAPRRAAPRLNSTQLDSTQLNSCALAPCDRSLESHCKVSKHKLALKQKHAQTVRQRAILKSDLSPLSGISRARLMMIRAGRRAARLFRPPTVFLAGAPAAHSADIFQQVAF